MEVGKTILPQVRHPFDCIPFWPILPPDAEIGKFLDGFTAVKDNTTYSFTKSVKSADGKTTVEIKSTNSITCDELLRAIEDVLSPTANSPMKTKKKKKVRY